KRPSGPQKLTPEEIGCLYWSLSTEDRQIAMDAAADIRRKRKNERMREYQRVYQKEYSKRRKAEWIERAGLCPICKRQPVWGFVETHPRCSACHSRALRTDPAYRMEAQKRVLWLADNSAATR